MNDDIEKLLKEAPLASPDESLDRRMDSLLRDSDGSDSEPQASGGFFMWRIPAWGAGLACVVCFLIGQAFSEKSGIPRQIALEGSSPVSIPSPAAADDSAGNGGDAVAAPRIIYIEAVSDAAGEIFNANPDRGAELFFAATHRFKPKG